MILLIGKKIAEARRNLKKARVSGGKPVFRMNFELTKERPQKQTVVKSARFGRSIDLISLDEVMIVPKNTNEQQLGSSTDLLSEVWLCIKFVRV